MSDVLQLFNLAVANDENSQLQFACNIPVILEAFPQEWIENQFISFLANWLPRNNKKIVPVVVESLSQIISAAGSLFACATFIEALLSPNVTEITKRVCAILSQIKDDPSSVNFLLALCSSKYDCVRAFVPSILVIVDSAENQRNILSRLVYDGAFIVRHATTKAITLLPDDLALLVTQTLANDQNARIRAYLPVICSSRPFWLTSVAPTLITDHDWSVRASVASELIKCNDCENAFTFASHLINDGVWQVKLCALRSMTNLIRRIQSTEINGAEEILSVLSEVIKLFHQFSLKIAVIDAFLSIIIKSETYLNSPQVVPFILDVLKNQPKQACLHFLQAVVKSQQASLIQIFRADLFTIVDSLSKSDLWRVRLGIVRLLSDIYRIVSEPEIMTHFTTLCFQILNDEATPVREQAAIQLSNFSAFSGSETIPQFFIDLSKSDSFRKRQAAVRIIQYLFKKSSIEFQKVLLTELEKFMNDPCDNVVEFAKYVKTTTTE